MKKITVAVLQQLRTSSCPRTYLVIAFCGGIKSGGNRDLSRAVAVPSRHALQPLEGGVFKAAGRILAFGRIFRISSMEFCRLGDRVGYLHQSPETFQAFF
jgi:hypothetical protein